MMLKMTVHRLRQLIVETLTDPVGGWRYFHITPNDRGNQLVLEPRIPTWTAHTDAEDFTTPRVCLATSVAKAVMGKFGSDEPSSFGQAEMFVYAARSGSRIMTPTTGIDLGSSRNPWGPDWSFARYAEDNNVEPTDEEHARVVNGIISDDPQVTGEVWSLAPIRMTLVGRLWPSHSGKERIQQKWLLRAGTQDS
jgi:hypothetical protein